MSNESTREMKRLYGAVIDLYSKENVSPRQGIAVCAAIITSVAKLCGMPKEELMRLLEALYDKG